MSNDVKVLVERELADQAEERRRAAGELGINLAKHIVESTCAQNWTDQAQAVIDALEGK